ncbi:MAG: hypothetical protein JWP67_178 [Mucilaginibacter sp.]|nr:hypothetical protein [Mucilaginibacter sp.]
MVLRISGDTFRLTDIIRLMGCHVIYEINFMFCISKQISILFDQFQQCLCIASSKCSTSAVRIYLNFFGIEVSYITQALLPEL